MIQNTIEREDISNSKEFFNIFVFKDIEGNNDSLFLWYNLTGKDVWIMLKDVADIVSVI